MLTANLGTGTDARIKPWKTEPRPSVGAPLTRLPLAAAIHFACFAPVFAAAPTTIRISNASDNSRHRERRASDKAQELGAITVTAQKRTENVQDVPISMDVLDTDKLTEIQRQELQRLREAAAERLDPAASTSASPQVYMRGVASGSNGNHSGPLPSVGMYLDEEPITTIQGALDMNIYDVERVEALAGPQGTLYGASSQSGTIRIITNKPDPSAFSASVERRGQQRSTTAASATSRRVT